jgi:sortase A
MRRGVRILGLLLAVAGGLAIAWTITVWRWQDPFTALYTHHEQAMLAESLDHQLAAYAPQHPAAQTPAAEAKAVAHAAARYRRRAAIGQAIGRIVVPRLGLKMVLVNGTDEETLKKGPGRYLGSAMPGQNRLVYIAGHRTTYLAPFSHIDRLRAGDRITLEMPYATFVYAVTRHRIVRDTDVSVLRSPRHELLELQACHPRFFATHRYIVYARPIKVVPRGEPAYLPSAAPTTQKVDCTSAAVDAPSFAALARGRTVAYRRPGGAVVRRFASIGPNGFPTVFAIRGVRLHGCEPTWYRVQLPSRSSRAPAWIRASAVSVSPIWTRIVVHVRAARLELERGGRIVLRSRISPGAPDTPTPLGRFFVTERMRPTNPSGPWGPAALGTSAYSPVLHNWPQGGPIGIHGTDDPTAIGRAASHGCIRLPNAAMERLFRATPAGTPVLIEA